MNEALQVKRYKAAIARVRDGVVTVGGPPIRNEDLRLLLQLLDEALMETGLRLLVDRELLAMEARDGVVAKKAEPPPKD